jgi:transcriptional regulator with XRE-family HTH domain
MTESRPSLGDVVAAAVRAERARHRWTQEHLAHRLGWSTSTLSALESGQRRPAVDDLPLLCEALGVSFDELVGRADPEDIARLRLH